MYPSINESQVINAMNYFGNILKINLKQVVCIDLLQKFIHIFKYGDDVMAAKIN